MMEQQDADAFWGRYKELAGEDTGILNTTGIRQSTLSTWRTKKRFPGADDAVKIAKELKTTVEYLVTGAGISLEISAVSEKIAAIAQKIADLSPQDREEIMLLVDHKLKKSKKTAVAGYKYSETVEVTPPYLAVAEGEATYSLPIREKVIDNVVFYDWSVVEIPLLGSTAAGHPINFGDIEPNPPTRPWATDLIRGDSRDYYCVLVRGTSMTDADIKDGDYALLKRAKGAESGEIMLVRHEDSSTLKRVKIIQSPTGQEEVYICWEDGSGHRVKVEGEDYEIQGKLVAIERKPGKR